MNPPKVFISATSGDLRSARQIVKEALLTINCHPVEQANFEPDYRSVVEMLRGKIGDCQALIHLVGLRYGAEPDLASLPAGTPRRSYTQMEYDLARELGLRVYTFVLPEGYPYDTPLDAGGNPAPAEPAERRDLQVAHRAALLAGPHRYETPADHLELRTRVVALQEKVIGLETEQRNTTTAVDYLRRRGGWIAALIVVLLLGGVVWNVLHDRTQAAATAKLQQQMAEQAELVRQTIAKQNELPRRDDRETPEERYQRALAEVAFAHHLKPDELKTRLDQWSAQVQTDPQADPVDKALAAYHAQHYAQAADLAAGAYQAAMTARERDTRKAIQAAQLEGDAQQAQAHYDQALAAYRKAAALVDHERDPLGWATAQYQVATVLLRQAKYPEAEKLLLAILEIREQHLGEETPAYAAVLNNLALLLRQTNRLSEAEPLYHRALKICEAAYGPEDPNVATISNNLAEVLRQTNRLSEAEPLYQRALKIDEASYGPEDPDVARDLNNLALLLSQTSRPREAEPLYRRALKIYETAYGPEDPTVATVLNNLALLFRQTDRLSEAEPLYHRALKICEAAYGPEHPDVATVLLNVASMLLQANRLSEAESLYHRALKIYETVLGPEHPYVARALNNLAMLKSETNRLSEAEPLYLRALKIDEAAYGPEHPDVAEDLNNLALLLSQTNRLSEAEPLYRRAVGILLQFEARTGHRHPNATAGTVNYLVTARQLSLGDQEAHRRLDEVRQQAGLDSPAFENLWQDALAQAGTDGLSGPFDVTVAEVIAGGQGEGLGLKAGDVIVRYRGEAITRTAQLVALTGTKTDATIPLEVRRDGELLHLIAQPGRLGVKIQDKPRANGTTAAPPFQEKP